MLTTKQKELLILIRDRLKEQGVSPSFDEMRDALGLRSKSGIHRLITALEERGFLRRLPHRARALEILKMPEGSARTTARSLNRKATSVAPNNAHSPFLSIPLFGRIAAGTPIEALRDPSNTLDVPLGLLAGGRGDVKGADHYALEVSGDSMIDAGIFDGDRVIIRSCDAADNGSIVVALVDEQEATLKYIERRQGNIALIPANKNYETRILPASQIKVQGKLVGLIRKY